jgi:hypothetical protein
MDRTLTVDIEGKIYLIGLDYAVALQISESTGIARQQKDGKLVVDGNEIITWKDDPKEIKFEIGDKPAIIRKKGLFGGKLEFFLEGRLIKPN